MWIRLEFALKNQTVFNRNSYISNIPENIKDLIRKTNQGDSKSQYELGFHYENSEGIEHDYNKAVPLYMKSAEQGYSDAQNNLGRCYYNGYGVEEDDDKAIYWYKKAGKVISLADLSKAVNAEKNNKNHVNDGDIMYKSSGEKM